MAADEMQVRLTAKDDLTRELKNATKNIAKLEAQLRDLGDATSPEAERDVRRLTAQLDKAYDKSKVLSGAVGKLDEDLDQMGYSAKRAGDKTSGMTRDMDKSRRGSQTFAAGWGKMLGVVAGVTAAVQAAGFAFRFLGDSIAEARQARKAMAQTAAVMKSMGRTETPKRVNRMIDQLESMSGIDGDNIREMTNVLMTFGNVTGDTFEKANALALDVSTSFGKDLSSSAVMVGKALNDPAKGLTALSRIGVQFTQQQTDQVKAMMEAGNVAEAQKIILAELERQVGGSTKAQADMIDKTSVAWGNLKEEVGQVAIDSIAALTSMSGMDPAQALRRAAKWIRNNKGTIIESLAAIGGAALRTGEYFLIMSANTVEAIGGMLYVLEPLFWAMEKSGIPVISQIGQVLRGSGTKALDAAEGMRTAAEGAHRLADDAYTARDRMNELNTALEKIKNKKVRIKIFTTMTDVQAAVDAALAAANGGDTTVGMGTGSLGAAGLAAYHGAYSSALGGHSILSGVRGSNLGSVHSDHRYGRAMDVQGPRLGAYAQVVRRNGGYAAMHGAGGNRHLHVVPQTRRPAPMTSGGNTFHADVVVNNPRADMDIQAAVARGLRDAERQTRERR
jgi:hypothetical protein